MTIKPETFNNDNEFTGSNFVSHDCELEFLKDLGFATNPYNKKLQSLEQVWEYSEEINKKREGLNYPIDGLVVKINDNKISSQLGVVGKTPRGWCAIKFAATEVTTKVNNISWQVGRTGKVTPVADLEPVQLDGTIVKRATLHNSKEVVERAIIKDDTIVIRKAGDIIPEVVNVIEGLRKKIKIEPTELIESNGKFIPPKKCPDCNAKLFTTETGVDLVCKNSENCRAQVEGRLSYYASRNMANIVGLSEKIVERFMDEYKISDIPDLYDLDWDKISKLEGFGEKSAENLKSAIEDSKKISDIKFLASLGIDGIGPEVSKLIIKKINSKSHE